ncbi:UDP-N-acetylmuramoyl-tripeptide--D-alanyl-D-alanine ligase [Colwellia sp. RSH04]|uniref:UDP-N-acetylmuramoyl-tripeptide--D-alanyl-D- alanine ligase n=1 Tax=Colwellia sp. RSH04 TaxID=2305464 RepID=UPI000E56F31F|nr:UDP-N-acetylmuramoyl-tripeptide--D-alanyl-D-alanine ligase [Colwellia sp. RSH04]RHW76717.1 UDP-N-acetylmuramoyl-tripeptide--D-alanyl-D-alanine ligase [Colwellia sp. RSH04]
MIPLTIENIAVAAEGTLYGSEKLAQFQITNIVTDSRVFEQENKADQTAFLALKGANFDGHRFVKAVVENDCIAVIVEQHLPEFDENQIAQIVVQDTRVALGKLGAYVKKVVAPKTVAITGSSGKTTVKEMVAAILSRLGNVLATLGNFNNEIGVPLTLLRLDKTHEFAVIELGANHIGEIAYTTNLVKPDVAVINNIAAAHLEGFGDLCGVARAKGEIFSSLTSQGVALYNKDTRYTDKWQWRLIDKNVRTFSCFSEADCFSSDVQLDQLGCASFQLHTRQGQCLVKLNIPGKHNVCNAVAAASIALEFGASLDDICHGLAQMKPVKGRLNLYQLTDKVKLIDDSYNANLESAKAAAQLLSSYPGKQILILGDMGELGAQARSYHQQVGEFAAELDINTLLTLGVLSQSACDGFCANKSINEANSSQHFSHKDDLLNHIYEEFNQLLSDSEEQIAILIKGSRSAHMEHVVKAIIEWFEQYEALQNKEVIS